MSNTQNPPCRKLVLDAGPLLALSPLRGLAESFVTVPQVLEELKDARAREHLARLGASYGINIEVATPDAVSLTEGIFFENRSSGRSLLGSNCKGEANR